MTDLIKERIDQIRSGKVPSGYVKTRAGIMPVDWKHDVQAKHVFQSYTNKDHHGNYEILAATQENGIVPRSQLDKEIKCSDEGIDGYKIVSRGDFIISLRSFQGGIEYSGYDGLVSPAYTVLKPIQEISDGYYKYYFKSDEFISRLNGAVYGIRDGKQIGYEDFGDLYIHFPPLAEQRRITDILTYCDKIIAFYQQQMDELKKAKSYFLRKMFPQQGETTPKIRFPGFTSPWEQRKVSEIAPLQRGFDLPTADMEPGIYPVVMSNGIGGYHSKYKVKGPGVVTGRSGTIGKLHYIEDDYWPHNTTLWVTDFKGNNPKYTYYMYQRLNLGRFGSGSGVPTLNRNDVHDALIMVPSFEEQVRISDYFSSFDDLITLHQRKLDEARREKKALMQLLLTGIVRVKT